MKYIDVDISITCPKCGNKIPARRLMLLTNWNTVTCPTCSEKLQVRNRNFSRLVGASGALIEILIVSSLYLLHPRDPVTIVLLVALLPISATAVVLAWIKFLKLKPQKNV